MPGYAARGALQPLMPFIEDDSDLCSDFFGPIRQGLSVGDELYALGYDIGPIILTTTRISSARLSRAAAGQRRP